jgi:hypothetical protein
VFLTKNSCELENFYKTTTSKTIILNKISKNIFFARKTCFNRGSCCFAREIAFYSSAGFQSSLICSYISYDMFYSDGSGLDF